MKSKEEINGCSEDTEDRFRWRQRRIHYYTKCHRLLECIKRERE